MVNNKINKIKLSYVYDADKDTVETFVTVYDMKKPEYYMQAQLSIIRAISDNLHAWSEERDEPHVAESFHKLNLAIAELESFNI